MGPEAAELARQAGVLSALQVPTCSAVPQSGATETLLMRVPAHCRCSSAALPPSPPHQNIVV